MAGHLWEVRDVVAGPVAPGQGLCLVGCLDQVRDLFCHPKQALLQGLPGLEALPVQDLRRDWRSRSRFRVQG